MSDVIVSFTGVSKRFRRAVARPFLLRTMFARMAGRSVPPSVFWTLDDVSFELRSGEAIGLVGLNGAGKTTLLRMIAGTCVPTAGAIVVRGRVAPVLSVGLVQHPDMTGRECIELNARILGFTRSELAAKEDEIVAFAELEQFLDTPVRHYSSGMQARLGFAVAVHTEPDLMLIDEVLAGGDHAFLDKCTTRLAELRAAGTTTVMVSHVTETMLRTCSRVLWLARGKIALDGAPDLVCNAYLQSR